MIEYFARFRESDHTGQPLSDHLVQTALLAKSFATGTGFEKFAEVAGLLHDAGKYSDSWQEYLRQSADGNVPSEKMDHATAGAQLFQKFLSEGSAGNQKQQPFRQVVLELLSMTIMYHHGQGLPDMISPDGYSPYRTRLEKSHKETKLDEIYSIFPEQLKNEIAAAFKDKKVETQFSGIIQNISQSVTEPDRKKEHVLFDMGLFCRFCASCLIDADRLNSAQFETPDSTILADIKNPDWSDLQERLERHLTGFDKKSPLSKIRAGISERCRLFAEKPNDMYTLSAATGSGKTLASLRYALHYAALHHSKKIFIIAPYTSILEQNAGAIAAILETENTKGHIVLECHSDLIQENKKEAEEHSLLAERWNAPIICTTMVQFLESVFASGTGKIRRMHQLSDSVIIFDEIQTLPIKCIFLFDWLLPFLTDICHSTALLCTATQPALDLLDGDQKAFRLNLKKENEIIADTTVHFQELKRVDIVDKCSAQGVLLEDIADFAVAKMQTVSSLLIVVNTKPQALQLYTYIKEAVEEGKVYHLSTNMCPAHRKEVIHDIRDRLGHKSKTICISTRLIEAGVDLDFECAVRFLAGLDSIAQTAGRCNRNGLLKDLDGTPVTGKTYIFNIKDEKLGNLDELKLAQNVTLRVLKEYHENEAVFSCSILHPELISRYFQYYYAGENLGKLAYAFKDQNYGNQNIIDLLSVNQNGKNSFGRQYPGAPVPSFPQAFQTAWKHFEVIEQNTIGVLVPYGKGHEILGKFAALEPDGYTPNYGAIKDLLRESQQYSVNIYRNQLKNLSGIITEIPVSDGLSVYFVNDGYYSSETGLTKEFSGSSTQIY